MADETNPQDTGPTIYYQPDWNVETVHQTVVVQPGPTPAELTPEQLAATETHYRGQVVERYNRLGFAGLGVGDLRLSDVALDDVFVRLTLTVEKTVRESIPPEEWAQEREREDRSRNPFRRGEKKEDERPRERTITTHEPIGLGDALAQHALIVGEPGAGKSTLLRWLVVTFAAGHQREADRLGPQADADRLPLLVELGRLPEVYLQANSREMPNWKTFLPAHLTKQSAFEGIPALFLEQALAAGRCLLLCDGLDEIADLSARRRIADSLADYARSSANRLVLSSRPAGVSGSEGALGSRFQRLTIQRFAPEDVRRFFGFLCAQYEELTPAERAKEADALYAAVQAAPKTLELATTPLLATLLLLLWNENGYLPERRVELYERCCQMLIESWEAQHDVAYTGVLAEIGWERHLRLLAPLAYAIHYAGQRTDAPASELIPILAQAMQTEGLATPASATLEAEKFLRTLSLRSGLLQFLGSDRYGFPHLTFQEYLTARHIAAQPDPDYIDTVMVHLHKAWWREVHLLVIGHLGSGSEGAEKASKLLQLVLDFYRPPWRILRSIRVKWWDISALASRTLAARVDWQLERRLAWMLNRELIFAASGFSDCTPLGASAAFRYILTQRAQELLLTVMLDPGRLEKGTDAPQSAIVSSLLREGLVSEETVSKLMQALDDSDDFVRFAASRSVGQLGLSSEQVMSALIRALGDSDDYVRSAAAGSLGTLGQASGQVVLALAGALGDSSSQVRAVTASSLRKVAQTSEDVVSVLVSALGDSNSHVQETAAKGLRELGQSSEDVVSALVEALSASEWNVREAAIRTLGELRHGLRDIVKLRIMELNDSNFNVRYRAAVSLGELGYSDQEVISVLVGALESSDDSFGLIRTAAAKSLGQIGQSSPDVVTALVAALSDADWSVVESASKSLGQLGHGFSEAMPVLLRMIDDPEWYVRDTAAKSLAYVGQGSSEAMSALVVAIDDPEWVVRETAIRSLAHVGQGFPEAIAALIVAMDDPEWYVRKVAVESLLQLGQGESEAVLALIGALGDSSDDVRWAAARGLEASGQGDRDVVVALLDAFGTSELNVRRQLARILSKFENVLEYMLPLWLELLNDPDFALREVASIALGAADKNSPRIILALQSALNDPYWSVRHVAANSLLRLGCESPDILTSLVGMINEPIFLNTRIMIVRGLGYLGQKFPEVESILARALTDPAWEVRESAAKSLGELGAVSQAVVTALKRALKDSQKGYGYPVTYPVREAALGSLGQLKIEDETQLRTVLIALNRRLHDRDDDVRRAALTAIRRLLDGRQIPGYRWVPIRERQRRRRIRQILDIGVLGIGLVALTLWIGGIASGQLDFAAGWVRAVGGLAGLVSLVAGVDLWLSHRRRPPWER